MRDCLIEQGVPASAVIADDDGTSTREALRSAKGFGAGRWRRVLVVSSPYHIHRILGEAKRQGLDAVGCPARRPGRPTARFLAHDLRQHFREIAATAAYALSAPLMLDTGPGVARRVGAAALVLRSKARTLAGDAESVVAASDTIRDSLARAGRERREGSVPMIPGTRLAWPADGDLGSGFGIRDGRLHSGVDVRAPYGTPVRSVAEGWVVFMDWLGPYGHTTVIDHDGALATVYAHQASTLVAAGERVEQGQLIGYVGATGRCLGPHLHLETRLYGEPVDPMVYIENTALPNKLCSRQAVDRA